MMSDELLNLDKETLTALDMLIRQKERVAKAYNKQVNPKTFLVGNLFWKIILPMDKKIELQESGHPTGKAHFESFENLKEMPM